jgi:YbbR domain-containing protein
LKRLEVFLFRDWQYKILSLLIGIAMWFFINLGERVPMSIERSIEVYNREQGYDYRLERKKARIRLRVMERFVSEEMLEGASAGVNVKGMREGEYTLKVETRNLPKFVVSVDRIEPEYVKVRIIKAPEGGQ